MISHKVRVGSESAITAKQEISAKEDTPDLGQILTLGSLSGRPLFNTVDIPSEEQLR